MTLVVVVAAWWIKERYWLFIDTTSARSTVASATALGSRGRVRRFETPHTEENYLLKEMGFQIARKHARRLRRIARLAGFALPALGSLAALVLSGAPGTVAAGLALACAALGLVIERWLFFAEAKHTVTLYYGADAV
jgi:DMSO reductase anchor subunit